jgi:type II secretory ATPase GspE/PulE/Tfp pilus assembly ATPase PilB-like protein
MRRNSVKVCIRTRPTQSFAQGNITIDQEHDTIMVNTSSEDQPVGGMLNNKQNTFKFKFDHVFHNATQSAVYDLYVRDTVQGVVDGINGAVMSYGQTGSGKTFTMVRCSLFMSIDQSDEIIKFR